MGKKQYQAQARFAKQGSQPKKRQPQRQSTASQPGTTAEASQPAAMGRMDSSSTAEQYSYVLSDLKRTVIFAVVAFVILIVLAIIL